MSTKAIEKLTIEGITYVPENLLTPFAVNTDGKKAVLIRSYSAGVHYGWLDKVEDTLSGRVVTLLNARRVYSWAGACSLSQLALEGSKKPEKCHISVTLPEHEIIGVIEIIPLTAVALSNLNGIQEWKI